MSPSPDTHDSNSGGSTSVVMATPIAGAPEQAVKERAAGIVAMRADPAVVDNPYLAGLVKKTRGLKKKMEKIKKTETLSASGKASAGRYCCFGARR